MILHCQRVIPDKVENYFNFCCRFLTDKLPKFQKNDLFITLPFKKAPFSLQVADLAIFPKSST